MGGLSIFVPRHDNGASADSSDQDVNNSTPARTSAAGAERSGVLPIVYLFVLGFCFGVSFVLNKIATVLPPYN